jgi:hypothetical protein
MRFTMGNCDDRSGAVLTGHAAAGSGRRAEEAGVLE